jgi:exonuclease SbcC
MSLERRRAHANLLGLTERIDMQPLKVTLKGFRGIRDGLGRDELTLDFERLAGDAQLVAIIGGNGRGKSTLMECMTPYSTMPSRAAAAGPGGFSFYDHVYLPESVKDLTWAHEGRSYRSQIVIRLAGKRRTEAFLHVVDEDGRWRPVQLDDGTVSDGKVVTYDRCVETICGSADTFFTSVFAAQGKRPLAAPSAPDPGDQLLWALLAAKPDLVLVTGDKLPLRDKGMHGRVISPQAFVAAAT